MNYDQIVGQAPATTPELFKAAILSALTDIEQRLTKLESLNKDTEVENDT